MPWLKIRPLVLRGLLFVFLSAQLISQLPPAKAAGVLFQDTFDDPVYTNSHWTVDAGTWNASNGVYSSSQTYDGVDHYSLSRAGNTSWMNYSFSVDINNPKGVDKLILFRFNDWYNTYAVHMAGEWPFGGNYIRLTRVHNGVIELSRKQFFNTNNVWYKLRVEVEGETIKVFVDNAKIIEHVDPGTPLTHGQVALYVWSGNYAGTGSVTTSLFDNVFVTEIGYLPPSPTPLPVPLLKQTNSQWADLEYDTASLWSFPAPPTIARWGCALSASAMILQYYGVDKAPDGRTTTPATINDWLLAEPKGYLRNGHLNWWALRRFTQLANAQRSTSPILDFRKFSNFDQNALNLHLDSRQPDILGVKNNSHFVIATGNNNDSYFINDPYYPHTSLVSYGNTADSVMHYFTTSTNLSALYIASPPAVEMYLVGPDASSGRDVNGNLLPIPNGGNYTLNSPMREDTDDGNSVNINSEGFQELAVPVPVDGQYNLLVWSNNPAPFSLDLIGYNQLGTPSAYTISGITDKEDPPLIRFNFSQQDDNSLSTPSRYMNFAIFRRDINRARQVGWITIDKARNKLIETVTLLENSRNHDRSRGWQGILTSLRNEIRNFERKELITTQARDLFLEDLTLLGF